jgi:hypothetical protein
LSHPAVSASFRRRFGLPHPNGKEELLEFPGVVTELPPNATFRVKLESEHEIMRKRRISYRFK